MDDRFIALGTQQQTATGSNYVAEDGGSRYYLATSVVAPTAGTYWPIAGGHLPTAVWLNGQSLSPITTAARLKAGGNALVLQYDGPGRGYYVLATEQQPSSAASGPPFTDAAHWIWYPHDRCQQPKDSSASDSRSQALLRRPDYASLVTMAIA